MLSPKKLKFRKQQKRRIRGQAQSGNHLAFGEFGLMALEGGRITARQIEAARIAMTRKTKRGGQVWIKIFPDTPVSKKPAEVRMGKGKGKRSAWSCKISAGMFIYELKNLRFGRAFFFFITITL